jgi:hypothetical protein
MQILGSSSEAPVFLGCKAVSGTEVDFEFSAPVKVLSLCFSPAFEVETVEEGSTVRVTFGGGLGPGERMTADLVAEDEAGNTINVLVPFRARNSRLPPLLINELRTEYSKPRVEFIELKLLGTGNLGALRVFAVGNKNPLLYEFPPVEAAAGEYVVLHLRTIEEGCRDECGADLAESGGTDALATARDFWIPGTAKLLHKTDAVYVMDQDDTIIDAVILAEVVEPWWNKDVFAEAAALFLEKKAWKTADGKIPAPSDAVDTGPVKTAATKSISRNEGAEDTNTAADWYVTAASGATPGKQNK